MLDKLSLNSLPFFGKKKAAASAPVERLVCDFGRTKIIVIKLLKTPQGVTLTDFQKFTRPQEKQKDIEVLRQCLQAAGSGGNKIRISVKGQGVIVRFVQMPKMSREDLESAMVYEAEKYIPFRAAEVAMDFHILEDSIAAGAGTMMNLLLVAVKREEINPVLEVFQSAGFQVELVDIDALAFFNALEFFYPEDIKQPVAALDIGTEISTLVVAQNQSPKFIRDISYGGIDIIKRLKRKLGMSDEDARKCLEVDHAPAEEAAAILKEGIQTLVADLKVSLDYYLDQVQGAEPIKKLFLGGGGGYHPMVLEIIKSQLAIPVEVMQILDKVQIGAGLDQEQIKKNQGLLPVALGLGLREI